MKENRCVGCGTIFTYTLNFRLCNDCFEKLKKKQEQELKNEKQAKLQGDS